MVAVHENMTAVVYNDRTLQVVNLDLRNGDNIVIKQNSNGEERSGYEVNMELEKAVPITVYKSEQGFIIVFNKIISVYEINILKD